MKGRLFVVNNKFMKNLESNMEINVLIPKPVSKTWYKTLTDIIADMFQMKKEDKQISSLFFLI